VTDVAVVDTNVWLDLFVFLDPRSALLMQALGSATGPVAVRCAQTDAEIESVLRRPRFAARCSEHDERLRRWRALARPCDLKGAAPWSCRDRDDQKFLDLACAARATLLLTKDKALLSLNRRTRREGLLILSAVDFGRNLHHDGASERQRVVQRVVPPQAQFLR